MASLAPGNGWFPNRIRATRNTGNPETHTSPRTAGNVYAFPGTPIGAVASHQRGFAPGSAAATRLAAILLAESIKAGHSVGWVQRWFFVALALVSLAWLGLAGVLIAAALLYGVSWMTVAIAAAATHVLGASLVILIGVRIGRALLLSHEKRLQLLRQGARA